MSYGAQQPSPLWSSELYALGVVTYVGCVQPSVVSGLTTVGVLVGGGWGWPLACLAARSCVLWRLPVTGGQVQVLAWLAAGSGVSQG